MSTKISPDGMYYWDGQQWVSTLSHDGRSRWDGTQWVPLQASPAAAPPVNFQAATRTVREPTSWTRPMQLVVAAYYAVTVLVLLSLPLWMGGMMGNLIDQSVQRQQQLNPQASPLPVDFASSMTTFMDFTAGIVGVIGAAICVVFIIGALRRWTWVFWVVLVLSGFSVLSLLSDASSLAAGPAMASITGVSIPPAFYVFGLLSSLVSTALFVWLLMALVQRGPWAMRRVAAESPPAGTPAVS